MRQPQAALCLIESWDHSDLLAVWNERANGWSLPGGGLEGDETPAYAAARELKEETGLVSMSPLKLIYAAPGTDKQVELVWVFRVSQLAGEIRCETERRPVRYMSWETFLRNSPWAEWYRAFRTAMAIGGTR